MNIKALTLFVMLITQAVCSQGLPAAESFKIARNDGTNITYYLLAQDNPEKTLLVLIQGSDCNSVRHNKRINSEFPGVMPQASILTVEKYGISAELPWSNASERDDCPAAYIENDSPKQRVKDYTQVLSTLRKERKYKRIILLGGSEGAVVANLLASELPYINATVSLNGGAPRFIDDVLHNIKSQSPSAEAYQEAANGFTGFYKHILNSEPFELSMSGHGYRWWRNMFEIDQTAILSKVETPLLLIQSGMDKNVSVRLAQEQATELSKDQPNIEFKMYNNLDHSFKRPDGSSRVDDVVQDIKSWLDDSHKPLNSDS